MEALIFDCDGVLVDSEAIAEATLLELLGEWLPDLAVRDELKVVLGMTTENILRHLEAHSAYPLPAEASAYVDDAIEARLADELRPIDGVAAAIAALELPLAVVSNSRRSRVLVSLATTGLDAPLGDTPIVSADQVAHPKPDPAIYRLAAEHLGCVPDDCLVVEDSVSGVTAAHRAGMTVVGFTGASHVAAGQAERLREAGAWRVLDHMRGLAGLVQQWRDARQSASDG
ncbi:HAD family hydrolase [Halomonas nitroreducens]|uniref:HAD family phosphatase n=1 Tax=Halomonas nitroreducens TaxID=447425 RepID=A0A3S0JT44_9GAMM|nr:HAD family phosphatase [Halomonas nitroreducens]RTQ97678.1 HAD family phosphatase [Halomonas nitroreducens]